MNQNKSWSTFEIKSVNDGERVITGIASTPSTDRAGDIVEPKGAKFTLPIPLLSQHDHSSPIGSVTSAKVTDQGIEIQATIPKDTGLDYVERAWLQIKSGLVRGLSIGFQALKAEPIKGSRGMRFKEWSWHELSCVTIPCNAAANIQTVKRFDSDADGQLANEMRRNDAKDRALAAIDKATLSLSRKSK